MSKILSFKTLLGCLSVIMVLFFFSYSFTYAQNLKKAFIALEPYHPTPGKAVVVRLEAPSIDIATALITWRINGEIVEQAYAEDTIRFIAGKVGTYYNISVTAEDGSGARTYQERSLVISDISLIWEGVTYTHPFYKGRALPSQGSKVAVQALARVVKNNGSLYAPEELSYSWYTSGDSVAFERGRGKHSITIDQSRPYEELEIVVEVKDPSGEVRATVKKKIPYYAPEVVLYEKNPLVGIVYDRAIGDTFGIFGGETTLIAEPYYMSAVSRFDTPLSYVWEIGENENTNPGSISLKPEAGAGTASLDLVIKNNDYWLQSARADLTIEFGTRGGWGDPNTEAL